MEQPGRFQTTNYFIGFNMGIFKKLGKLGKGILGTVAPGIGLALGGPLGAMAAGTLMDELGISPDDPKAQSLMDARIQNPTADDLVKIKEAELKFQAKLKELEIDLEKVHAGDRASARLMQTATKSIIVPVLAGLTVAGFFGVVFFILTGKVPMDSTITGMVLGTVGSKAEQIYNFYFGSSKGSKDKTNLLKTS